MKKLLFILLCIIPFGVIAQVNLNNNKVKIDANGKVVIDSTVTFGTSTSTNVSIDATNGVKLNGNSTVWDDLFFPFTTGNNGGNPYPTFDQDSMYWNFVIDTTGPTICKQFFTIQLPHSYKEESSISPHVHFKYETAVGTPVFIMKYKWYNISGTTQTGFTWIKTTGIKSSTDKTHSIAEFPMINGSGKGMSSILVCQIYLFSQSGTGNVHAWQMDIHYQRDAMGSKDEYVK